MTDTSAPGTEPLPVSATYGVIKANVSAFVANKDVASGALPDRDVSIGKCIFMPTMPQGFVVDNTTGDVIFGTSESVPIRSDGTFEVTLVANDNPNLVPTGWHYNVSIRIDGEQPINATIDVPGGTTSILGYLLVGGSGPTPSGGSTNPGTTTPALTVTPSSDGSTVAFSGSSVTDNGDGTATISGATLNSNGTANIAA